jgi:phosphopantothenoylcysteine decarboxylase/phosphopantothenate--cysteine ligase
MDGGMYNHPATQANLNTLLQHGATIIGPVEGHLASGMQGTGRMVEPQELLGHIRLILSRGGPLAGYRIVVSAGGTWEPIDPVRAITNRSSGKQGYALAQAALDYGADVTLISGPTDLSTPVGAQRLNITTAEEMLSSVSTVMPETDVLIMAAAVADFRPAQIAIQKLKKEASLPLIELEPTPDILHEVARYKSGHVYPRVTIGFAAESQSLMDNARSKLKAKNLDLIVANDITASDAGFGVDTNRVVLLDADGGVEKMPLMSKAEVASVVMERVVSLLENKTLPGVDPDM